MPLYTFGYEGLSAEAFISRLQAVGVKTVLDVRQLPLSRKPGFSKSVLADRLHKAGILYAHLPALGCPRPIRLRYKQDASWANYVRGFTAYLRGQGEAIAELAKIAKETTACLVCFEEDYRRCHRSFVARAAARVSRLSVVHLTIRSEIPEVIPKAA